MKKENETQADVIYEALKFLRDASREFSHLILNSKHNKICDKYKYPQYAKFKDAIANAGLTLSESRCLCGKEKESTCDKTSQVGNTAKLRLALEWLSGFGYITTDGGFHMPDAKMARNEIESALAAPARNCDRYANAQDAINAWNSMSQMEQSDFDYITQWLFAETKGEAK